MHIKITRVKVNIHSYNKVPIISTLKYIQIRPQIFRVTLLTDTHGQTNTQ